MATTLCYPENWEEKSGANKQNNTGRGMFNKSFVQSVIADSGSVSSPWVRTIHELEDLFHFHLLVWTFTIFHFILLLL